MLRGIRKASENWLGRSVMTVIMAVLVGSFAIWGINDIFRGFGRSTLAKIGNTEISIEQFRQNYNDRLQQLSRQIGHPIPPEQAAALHLDQQILGEMIEQAALDQRARQMRLAVSDAEISRLITSNPSFENSNGQFDRTRFEQLVRSIGFTEQSFIASQREDILRRQITDSVAGGVVVANAWIDAINQYQNQERSIAYIALGPAQAGDIPPPTTEQLSKYFDDRKILFRAPEYRTIETVTVTPAELAKWIEVSDDDVKKEFEQNRNHYTVPERRHIEQIVFPTMADAEAASQKIKDGTSFAAVAAERGFKEADIDLGTVAKSALVDPAVANAAFSLKQGEVSAPIQGQFGPVLVTVLNIEPEVEKSLAEVGPQIRNAIALERAKTEVQSIHDKIEDARGGGASLQEAAEKVKIPVVTVDLDRSGHDPKGTAVSNLPHATEVINAAFASDVGVDNDPIDADGGYIWYDVASIAPAHERPLDEVKGEVEARWRDDEVEQRLKAKAAALLDQLKNGSALDALAAANGVKVETADGLKRGGGSGAISARVIDAIFHTAKDAAGSAPSSEQDNWIVFRVTDMKTPALVAGSPAAKAIEQTLQQQLSEDLLSQYMAWLEDNLGTNINAAALSQALGNGQPSDSE